MKRMTLLIFALVGPSGCALFSQSPAAVTLTAADFRSEYVGHEFQSKEGDSIQFRNNYTYQLSDGSTGIYEFTNGNTIKFTGNKSGYFVYPDGFKVGRPDMGLEFTVYRIGDVYTHTLVGGLRSGTYTRIDRRG